mgnify:CR=1 FL=1
MLNGFFSSKSTMSTSEKLQTSQFCSCIKSINSSSFLYKPLLIFKLEILNDFFKSLEFPLIFLSQILWLSFTTLLMTISLQSPVSDITVLGTLLCWTTFLCWLKCPSFPSCFVPAHFLGLKTAAWTDKPEIDSPKPDLLPGMGSVVLKNSFLQNFCNYYIHVNSLLVWVCFHL